MEQTLVARVRNEHRHGLRTCMRLWRCCSDASSTASLFPAIGVFSAATTLGDQLLAALRCSCVDVLRVSLLLLLSGGLRDCFGPRGGSLGGVISLLVAGLSDVFGVAGSGPSSSSAELEGRLLIERYPGDNQHPQQQKRQ